MEMHKIDVLLGLQWGDEGKGKVVREVVVGCVERYRELA